jgi:two-component sensor histidine kinase
MTHAEKPHPQRLPRRRGPQSLWSQLALLTCGVALPSLIVLAVVFSHFVQAETRRLEADAAFASRSVAQAIERDIAVTTGALRALAELRSLQVGDLERFHANALRVAEALELGIVLFDLDGQQLVNTRRAFGEPLPMVHATVAKEIPTLVARGDVVVTDSFMGQLAGQLLYVVMVPVLSDETREIAFGLQLSIPAERIQAILSGDILDPNLLMVVADRQNITVARSSRHEELVGLPATTISEGIPAGEPNRFTSATPRGDEVLGFTALVPATGWTVAAAISKDTLTAPVRGLALGLLALAAALFAIAALGATLVSRRILRALDQLVASADAMRSGATLPKVATTIREIDHVAAAHRDAAGALRDAMAGQEALLYEVNHRVKNSLALVASILSLHARQARGTDAADVLLAARVRVDLVATLHRRLYEDGRHNAVDLGRFLEEVTRDSLAALDRDGRISFTCDTAPDVVVKVDRATPIAVIVSELVVNAVKHAFPDRETGRLHLFLHREAEGIRVGVVDDGIGTPQNDAGEIGAGEIGTGVGTKVIHALVRQIRGRLERSQVATGSSVEVVVALDGER